MIQPRLRKVDGVVQESGNSAARQHAAVVRSLSPTQPFGRPHGGRGRGGEVAGGQVEGSGQAEEMLMDELCALLSWGPLFI
jgi:hypothetical protein